MIGFPLLLSVAVLAGDHVAVLSGKPMQVTAMHRLPAVGAAMFAAPDGRLVVPLQDRDATVCLAPDGSVMTWTGRIFPMFFDEFDRLLAAFPHKLVTLEYPERVEIESVPLPDVSSVWRAACSSDGRLAAIVPAVGERREVVLSESRRGGMLRAVQLPGSAEEVAVAPDGGWVAVGLADGRVAIVSGAGPMWNQEPVVPGRVAALAVDGDGATIGVGIRGETGSTLVLYRVRPGHSPLLKLRARVDVPGSVSSMALDGDEAFVAMSDRVLHFGRSKLRGEETFAVPGATVITLLPDNPRSAVPKWDEATKP